MKKPYPFRALALIIVLVIAQPIYGAITDYQFSNRTSSYTEYSGGTVSSATGDDGTQNISLPFTFTYDGVNYTTARICTNGWLEMGTSYSGNSWVNDLASTDVKPILAPLWDDLSLTSSGVIRYLTLGSSPNRTFIVQWDDVSWRSSGQNVNFQIQLKESNNSILFHYGPNYSSQDRSASIGINDATGGSGHFISVTPNFGSPTISSTTSNNNISTNDYPGNGKIYEFTPRSLPEGGPVFTAAWMNDAGNQVSMEFTDDMQSNPSTSGFTVRQDGNTIEISSAARNSSNTKIIELNLSGSVEETAIITIDYNDGPSSLQGSDGSEVAGFLRHATNHPDFLRQTRIQPPEGENPTRFGENVSMSGDYLVVGTEGDGSFVHQRSGTAWNYQTELTPSDQTQGFGNSAIDGDYIAVAAWGDDDNGNNAGAMYIFHRSGNTWSQQAKVTASDGEAGDLLGDGGISIHGEYAAVGTIRENNWQGAVYIFHRSGTSWTQQAKLTASDAAQDDWFGFDVSLNGDYVVVGTYNSESAYVFHRSGTSWTQQAILTASDGQTGDHFGRGVSLNGDYALVGSPDDDGGGSAYVFHRSGSSWTQQARLIASDRRSGDRFGWSVALYGPYAAIGAPAEPSTYIFKRSGSSWTEQTIISTVNWGGGSYDVALHGDFTIIGIYNYNSAYVYWTDPCRPPTDVTASNITFNSADISWTAQGGVTQWDLRYGSTTIENISSTSYNLTGLNSGTTYDAYVRSDCGDLNSTWVGPARFTTLCNAPTGLNAANIAPTSVDLTWDNCPNGRWDIAWGTTGFTPETPNVANHNSNNYHLNGLTYETSYEFYVRTHYPNDDVSDWVGPVGFTTLACDLPSGLSISAISYDDAIVSWTDNCSATQWDIAWGESGFTPQTPNITATTTTTDTLTGLLGETAYDVYVRINHGDGDVSAWVGPETFTTLETPPPAGKLSFRGVLRETVNEGLLNGDYNITFRLYDQETGGTPLWSETHDGDDAISVRNGTFSTALGDVQPFTNSYANFGQPTWLAVSIDGDTEMTPRSQLTAAPYAFNFGQDVTLKNLRRKADRNGHEPYYSSIGKSPYSSNSDPNGPSIMISGGVNYCWYAQKTWEVRRGPNGVSFWRNHVPDCQTEADYTMREVARIAADGTLAQVSDQQRKKDIEDLGSVGEEVMQLQPVQFRYQQQRDDRLPEIGFIAQDVEPLFPALVATDSDGYKRVDYAPFGVLAIAAFQEKYQQMQDQQQRLIELQTEMNQLKTELKMLLSVEQTQNR